MSIGKNIRYYRKLNKITQSELGKLVGLSGVAIMRYEKEQREPNQEIVTKIANALDVSELTLRNLEPTCCDWCNPKDLESEMVPLGIGSSERLYVDGYASYDEATLYINIFSEGDSEEIDGYVKIKYCPFCGRHLEHDVSVYD